MKVLPKYEYARRFLERGNKLTYQIAISRWYLYSFRIFLGRERKRLRKIGKDIINLNEGTGKHGIYIHSDYYENN